MQIANFEDRNQFLNEEKINFKKIIKKLEEKIKSTEKY